MKMNHPQAQKNKPNSNPISKMPKMNVNAFSQKDYENELYDTPRNEYVL